MLEDEQSNIANQLKNISFHSIVPPPHTQNYYNTENNQRS